MSELQLYRARWVLPLTSPPLPDGVVAVRDDRVIGVGARPAEIPGATGARVTDLGEVIVLPGLVNAHTHLSLTTLPRDLPRGDWFAWMAAAARAAAALTPTEVRAAVRAGADESWRLGTVLVGEVTTRPEGTDEIAAQGSLSARVFFEFLGISEPRARERFEAARDRAAALVGQGHIRLRPGLSPHAPYSVWPDLWREVGQRTAERTPYLTTHLAEPPGEDEFLLHGTGPVRDYLDRLGVWDGSFPVPGRSAVSLLDEAGVLGPRSLLVHGVHLTPADLPRLVATGTPLCLCPRSNARLGLPLAPVGAFQDAGIPLCLGTDSRAGNDDLSLWAEMRALRELAPELPAEAILRMGTVNGARALGFPELATGIRPGAAARLLIVNAGGVGDDNPCEFLLREPVEAGVGHLLHL
jgi:cytosine/adenosine deaminase-related metal-dependent hydrolase